MKGSDISSPPCHPACPERSTFPVSRVLHRGPRERSSPIFSSAPHLGVSGCVVEGPWQHLNLNQAPRASNQLDRREAWGRSSPLLRRPGLQVHPENPTTPPKPPPKNPSPNTLLRPKPPSTN